MATDLEYALMAGGAYITSRPDPINQFPIPGGWTDFFPQHDDATGFEAISYTNGTEIVISYAGTNPDDVWNDIVKTDFAAGLGLPTQQLFQAAEYYMQVRAANPGAHITFTGHSLGGGLASLMGIFFNETAVTFDQAPFRNCASALIALQLETYLTAIFPASAYPQIANWLDPIHKFILSFDPFGLGWSQNGLAAREAKVTGYNTQGEFLSLPYPLPVYRIGTSTPLTHGTPDFSLQVALHSQALLTVFLKSKDFEDVTFKLPDLIRLIFDDKMYNWDTKSSNENFIERLVRHEFGNTPDGIQADAMLGRFTRDLWKLAQEGGMTMTDGNDANGTPTNFNNVSKALTAFAMQMYYEDTANATNPNKELFTQISGGLQFDMADVSKEFKASFDKVEKLDLSKAKGYKEYFEKYLQDFYVSFNQGTTYLNYTELNLIKSLLPYLRDWYVQAGKDGMTATDTQNNGAFMLGGTGADTLTGGTGIDLLVGNAGDDVLAGGMGNDILLGGKGLDTLNGDEGADTLWGGADNDTLNGGTGNDTLKGGDGSDTYQFTGSFGTDLITDSDGLGAITLNGQALSTATQKIENIYKNDTTGYTVLKLNGGNTLAIVKEGEANRIIVQDWNTSKNLGIDLQDSTPAIPAATMSGDFKKLIDGHGTLGTDDDTYVMTNGNYTNDGVEANALDLISGTGGIDVIDGGGGDDALSGMAGDDHIEGGNGSDEIQGGMGKDTINGGAGADAIYGSSDEALIKPAGVNFAKFVNPYTNPQGTGFNWTSGYDTTFTNGVPQGISNAPRNRLEGDQGNIIDGGTGDDFIAAGTGADYVHGGADKDFIFGMDKDDILFGDGENDLIYGDGDKPSDAGGTSVVWALPENHGNDIIDGGDGDDYLFGQGKDDIIFGGKDNDRIWGDDKSEADLAGMYHGNDYLDGGDGNDQIVGGGKDDILIGGIGNDNLWGDDDGTLADQYHGNDFLYGGVGTDQLDGGAGNDYLEGGTGDDTILGGSGKDIYVFNKGDGSDTVSDTKADKNIFRFGAGISEKDIKLRLGSLMLDLGNGDAIHIDGFDQNDVFNSSSIGSFEFADGTSLTTAELLARGFDLDGTEGDDTLTGTNTSDRINGLGGNDLLLGMAGNDTLNGGTGNDILTGGDGSDTYLFNRGDGTDTLSDNGDTTSVDTVQFGAEILQSDVTLTRHANGDLLLKLNGSTDEVVVQGYYTYASSRIERVVFGDGSVLAGADFENLPITGTEGDDVITGTNSNDTILGLGGNDTLEGGVGKDTLQGGEGNDTYQFSIGTGLDTVIDASAGGNTIQLAPGISFSELRATQSGNDLLLLRSASHGMVLKDYYLTPQDWIVLDGNGSPQTISDLLTATANKVQDEYSLLRDEFFAEKEGKLLSDNPGVSATVGTSVTKDTNKVTQIDTTVYTWNSGGGGSYSNNYVSTYDRYSSSTSQWDYGYANILTLLDWHAEINRSAVINDEAYFSADVGHVHNFSTQYVKSVVSWGSPYNFSGTYSKSTQVGFIWSSGGVVGQSTTTSQIWSDYFSQDGIVQAIYAPADAPLGALDTRVFTNTDTFHLQEITGGASDNTIDAWNNPYAVVNGGAGNDTIYGGGLLYGGEGNDSLYANYNGGGFLYGGDGNDYLYGGMYQYGGNGNDILTYGQVLSGGAGDDTMDGDEYDIGKTTRYLIDPLQAGIDLIHDTGDSELAYKDWYYGTLGVVNWRASQAHGNQWVVGSGEAFAGGYDTFDEAVSVLISEGFALTPEEGIANGDLLYVPPLPPFERPAANDYAALQAAYDAGAISMDTVEFAEGITLGDLQLTWGEVTRISPVSWQLEPYRTLILSWNGGASQVQLVIPHKDDPLGSGVEQIKFSDNSVVGMQTLIAMAPAGVSLDPVNADLTLIGTETADVLVGQGGNDTIVGLAGDDVLSAGVGNDTLEGGAGNDILYGGSGSDTYVFEAGNGVDYIVDNAGDGNKLVFGAGVDPASVTLSLGSLLIKTGNGEDAIHIEGFDPNNALSTPVIESFQFADGTLLTYSQLLERGFDIAGTAADDALSGTNTTDRINGGAGNDILNGGVGNDALSGGAGNDRYLINPGDGSDTIVDVQGIDTLVIGGNLTAYNLETVREGDNLIVQIMGTTGRVTLSNWFVQSEGVKRFEFNDGSTIERAELEARFNRPPVANADAITVFEDGGLVNVPTATLLANDTDPNAGDVISVISVGSSAVGATVTLVNGNVQYDIGSSFQELAQGQTVTDTFNYTISDSKGLTASSVVTVTITGVNDAAVTADDTANLQEDLTQIVSGNVLANDSDIDQGTVLTVTNAGTLQGSYGSLVLNIDGGYSYVLDNSLPAVQSLAAGQTVTETFAYQASDGIAMTPAILTVSITGTNDAPVTAEDAASVQEDVTISATGNVLTNDSDVDQGATLTVLNAGSFTGNYGQLLLNTDGSYSYTLDNASLAVQFLAEGQVVTESFAYQVTDGMVATPAMLTVSITGTNDVPVTVVDVANVQEDSALTATGNVLANDSDVDQGTVLSVVNAGVFAGQYGSLVLNTDGSYSYALDNTLLSVKSLAAGEVVTEIFGYQATDGSAVTPSTLTINITGSNDAPIVSAGLLDQNIHTGAIYTSSSYATYAEAVVGFGDFVNAIANLDTSLNYQFASDAFADIDHGDNLTYSATLANGDALPAWMIFDPLTRTFSGTPTIGGSSVMDIRVVATDLLGATASDIFRLNLGAVVIGGDSADILAGTSFDDTLNGGGSHDLMTGGTGNDTYVVDNSLDMVIECANEGIDTVQSSVTYALGNNLEYLTLTGTSAISGTGNALNNIITGNASANILRGGSGNDVLEGADGNDILSDSAGNNLFNGGAGTDKLTGNNGNELFIGGTGNDTITTSSGADIIAFNKGDGQDTVVASIGLDNTISLGGGIQYANLAMSKSGNDLIFSTGNGDQITLQNWYARATNHSVGKLQVVLDGSTYNAASADTLLNQQVQTFDFNALATSFDQALAANPTLSSWGMTEALLTAHLAGSDTAALGGDLAYQYNLNNSLAGIGLASAQTVMNDASFGTAAQTLKPMDQLQTGW